MGIGSASSVGITYDHDIVVIHINDFSFQCRAFSSFQFFLCKSNNSTIIFWIFFNRANLKKISTADFFYFFAVAFVVPEWEKYAIKIFLLENISTAPFISIDFYTWKRNSEVSVTSGLHMFYRQCFICIYFEAGFVYDLFSASNL